MSSLNLQLVKATIPSSPCPSGVDALFALALQYISVSAPSGASFLIIQIATPGVDNQDKLWVKLNSDGTPEGLYIYSSGWKRNWNVPINWITVFVGTGTAFAAAYPGWQIADGTNGTSNMRAVMLPINGDATTVRTMGFAMFTGIY